MVKVGDQLPSIELQESTPANKVNIASLVAGKKCVIFGVPGAFTPGCSKTHLPGFLKKRDELRAMGIEEVICVAVNDAFVMKAWGKKHKAEGKVRMLADPDATFTKAIHMDFTADLLGGLRSKRYSMVLDHGVIYQLAVEPDSVGLTCSLADNVKV